MTEPTEKDRLRAEVRRLREHADEVVRLAEYLCQGAPRTPERWNELRAAVRAYRKSEIDR